MGRNRSATIAERVARTINRRDALRRVIVGGATGLAALAVGASPADAATCTCGPTRRCGACPEVGCPHGYHLCKGSFSSSCFNAQGFRCEWPAGNWIACMNLGKGLGYKVCYDCIGPGGCEGWCTCLSACICCHCASPADIRAEQQRLQYLPAGGRPPAPPAPSAHSRPAGGRPPAPPAPSAEYTPVP